MLTLMLAMLVGAMRLALVAYEQASVDGAAFYSAHENAVKNSDPSNAAALDPVAATHTAFPRSQNQVIAAPTTLPAPAMSQDQTVLDSGYGFDQTNNRHGGVSMIQPMQTLSKVTKSGLAALSLFDGGSVMVSGIGIDPTYAETGVHGNIAGNSFGTSASFLSANDYFTQGENTPPYFGGFHYQESCDVADDPNTSWNACPVTTTYRALGLAEYLDNDNWGRTPNGVAPAQQAVFWETLFHQQTYAAMVAALSAVPDLSSPANKAQAQLVLNHATFPAMCTIYAWDSTQQGGFPDPSYQPGQYPLHPGAASTCQ
jgi:hypothetical protein